MSDAEHLFYMTLVDYERLVEWMQDPRRKSPDLAFTAGAARTAAYAFVESGAAALQAENARLREQLEQLAKFVPKPQRPEMEG